MYVHLCKHGSVINGNGRQIGEGRSVARAPLLSKSTIVYLDHVVPSPLPSATPRKFHVNHIDRLPPSVSLSLSLSLHDCIESLHAFTRIVFLRFFLFPSILFFQLRSVEWPQ